MRITIKKWGNSAGVVIPGAIMKELNMQVGQSMEAQVVDNQVVLKPLSKRYPLEELLAQCDPNAAPATEDELWGNAGPMGNEVW